MTQKSFDTFRPVALITGATRGIGRAVAQRFALDGFDLALVYRSNRAAAQEATLSLVGMGARLHLIQADLAQPEAAYTVIEQTLAAFGALDVLVNNAGGTHDGAFAMMRPIDYAHVVRSNLIAPLRLSLLAALHLIASARAGRAGAVVMMSSMAGITGKEGQVPYATTKSGLIGVTRLLARRLGPHGVRVNAVAPGFIATEMVETLEPEMYEHVIAASATRRMGRPEEVAATVGFLAGGGASYLNGSVLRVDGGFLR
ncbi:SDR family oxidoreductase [Verminephrobacter aporrectodeae subsp. tuberculatae]|uniref:SDR family NAD(P)-dependent oxidoreductase n=1 Tax=Verminephrobacter aporrectodeae TaxID=1110389 RepID=UPI000237826F|nr:SDR family oxidoreductase [Verminephrobacter aporrectodeae]MCW8166668.1 SDR family oxidoreductase [Verminephrobacter aporrectodeae subsp. tuberculatae]MCW8170894.1 SDR family oxidoreductase [Verminephrobacter aporrectodeae subsp. tuberculatae]